MNDNETKQNTTIRDSIGTVGQSNTDPDPANTGTGTGMEEGISGTRRETILRGEDARRHTERELRTQAGTSETKPTAKPDPGKTGTGTGTKAGTRTGKEGQTQRRPLLVDIESKIGAAAKGKTKPKENDGQEIFQLFRLLADVNEATKPEILLPNGQVFSLKKLWHIPDEELVLLSDPTGEILAKLPDKYRNAMGAGMPYIALITGVSTVIGSRMIQQRQFIAELKRLQIEHTTSTSSHGTGTEGLNGAGSSGISTALHGLF